MTLGMRRAYRLREASRKKMQWTVRGGFPVHRFDDDARESGENDYGESDLVVDGWMVRVP
jgi:hypothetical protein